MKQPFENEQKSQMKFGSILSIEIFESTRKHRKDRMVKIFGWK